MIQRAGFLLLTFISFISGFSLKMQAYAAAGSDIHSAGAVKQSLPALVSIHSVTKNWHRVGSGFAVSGDGFVLTRQTVIQAADTLWIEDIHGRYYPGKPVSRDPNTELVLIKCSKFFPNPVRFGKSIGLKPPVEVMIVGNSLGIFPSLTLGTFLGATRNNMLHVQAWLPAGNCGAPVLNPDGSVLGMLAGRIFDEETGNPAFVSSGVLPVEVIRDFVERSIASLKKSKVWIGMTVADLEESDGVLVVDVMPGGPACRARISVGDTIVAFNNKMIDNGRELAGKIHALAPEKNITFSVRRNNQFETFIVRALKLF